MEIKCSEIKLVPLSEIKLNPKNRNAHSKEQIDLFVKLVEYQGYRVPGVISTRSGLLAAGEGRYLALQALGQTHMPIMYQDFDSDEQEYAFAVSDNAIARQAALDLAGINADLPDLGPDFDVDMLGIKDFEIEPADKYGEEEPPPPLEEQLLVVVECTSEAQQKEIFEELVGRGFKCKVMS